MERKALLKQKKLRASEVRIRDLEKSREYWKQRAFEAEKEFEQREEVLKDETKKEEPLTLIKAKGHHYSVEVIKLSIEKIMVCGNSLRGVEKNWELEPNNQEKSYPSYSIIREWLIRVGLYELSREKEKREDWLLIIDLSIELGKEKCLVILGVSQEYYIQEVVANQRALNHQDVEVLEIEIMTSTKGELINEAIEKTIKKVGKPLQIVSDHGSDLLAGIKLYLEKNPEVIHTYDITQPYGGYAYRWHYLKNKN